MRRLTKKIAASALALSLVFTMGTQCFAANWGSYFGGSEGWYEGAEGTLTSNTDKAWTAQMASIGYGGVWGAQVYKNGISVKKGQQYTLSFDAQSSTCDKWVYVKVSTDETLAFSDWVQLKKGSTTKYSTTFTAKANAKSVYFGIGGEFGDRQGVDTDKDAAIRYGVFTSTKGALSQLKDVDPTFSTTVKLTNFYLGAAKPAKVNLKSVKAAKKGKVKVKYKKVAGAAGYQIQYSLKSNMKSAKSKTTKKATYTISKLKKGKKYYVRVRAYNKGKKAYGEWSKKKAVKVK